jgi:hypothetical protein
VEFDGTDLIFVPLRELFLLGRGGRISRLDLDTKRVTLIGERLDDTDLRRAISDAGYEAP